MKLVATTLLIGTMSQSLFAGNSSGGGVNPPPHAYIFSISRDVINHPGKSPTLGPVRETAAKLVQEGLVTHVQLGYVKSGERSLATICIAYNDLTALSTIQSEILPDLSQSVSVTTAKDCRWLDQ
jgi:hypothetical protein